MPFHAAHPISHTAFHARLKAMAGHLFLLAPLHLGGMHTMRDSFISRLSLRAVFPFLEDSALIAVAFAASQNLRAAGHKLQSGRKEKRA